MKSGLSSAELEIQSQTLTTLHSLMCHSRQMTIEYFKQLLHINVKHSIRSSIRFLSPLEQNKSNNIEM